MEEAGVDGALIVQPINHKFDHSLVTRCVEMTGHLHVYINMLIYSYYIFYNCKKAEKIWRHGYHFCFQSFIYIYIILLFHSSCFFLLISERSIVSLYFITTSVLKRFPSKFVGCCLVNPAEDGNGLKQLENLVLKVLGNPILSNNK